MIFRFSSDADWFLYAALISYTLGVIISAIPGSLPVIGKLSAIAMLLCVAIWAGSFAWTVFQSREASEHLDDEETD